MVSVVIFHQTSSLFLPWIENLMMNPWNVAVFFIVAGYYLKWSKLIHPLSFIKGKLKTLYIPATIIYLCAVLLHNLFVYVGWYPLASCHPSTGAPYVFYDLRETVIRCVKVILCAGSGELVMGAMWFLYTLIYSMVGLTLLACIIHKACNNAQKEQWVFFFMLLFGAILSCIATQKYGFTINRVNVAFTAMFLINVGRLIKQNINIEYNNIWMFSVCALIFVQCFILQHQSLTMARNQYQDLGWLVLGSLCIIYIYTFIAKILEKSYFAKAISFIGRNSFYVMALHILGFFCCNSILITFGVFDSTSEMGMYTFAYGKNIVLLVLYTFMGLAVPLLIVAIKNKIQNFCAGCHYKLL